MFEILPVNDDNNILAFKASGKLTDVDYKKFLPVLEEMIRSNGQISLYVELQDFEGWEAAAAWDDLRFGLQHENDFKRIAIITDKVLFHTAIGFMNLFSNFDMKFFEQSETAAAWEWLRPKTATEQPLKPPQAYRNILLPTDFSSHSDIAAQRALQIMKQCDAKLYVVHAVEDFIYYDESYDPVMADLSVSDQLFMDLASEKMKKFCERNQLGSDVELITEWGNPKRSIISWAQTKDIDLIIMGSHGRHGVARLLGSVSTAILHKASCDVLIVKN